MESLPREKAQIVTDATGKSTYLQGVMLEITATQELQQELVDQLQHLNTQLEERAHELATAVEKLETNESSTA